MKLRVAEIASDVWRSSLREGGLVYIAQREKRNPDPWAK